MVCTWHTSHKRAGLVLTRVLPHPSLPSGSGAPAPTANWATGQAAKCQAPLSPSLLPASKHPRAAAQPGGAASRPAAPTQPPSTSHGQARDSQVLVGETGGGSSSDGGSSCEGSRVGKACCYRQTSSSIEWYEHPQFSHPLCLACYKYQRNHEGMPRPSSLSHVS